MLSLPILPKWPNTSAVKRHPPVVVKANVVPASPFDESGIFIIPTIVPITAASANAAKPCSSRLSKLPMLFFFESLSFDTVIFARSSVIFAFVNFGTSCTNSTTPITPNIYAIPSPTDTRLSNSGFTVAFAAENAGVDVSEPESNPAIIAVKLPSAGSPKARPIYIQPTAERPPNSIITRPISTYDLKFFFILPKKLGPAIKPTDVTNRMRPKFSIIFNALSA